MRFFVESTPIYESKPCHKQYSRTKPWNPSSDSKSDSSLLSSTTEELSLSSSVGSLPKDFDTFSSSKPKFDAEVKETKTDTKGLVGIIIDAPSSKYRCRKRVRFGDVKVISTHTPASEMAEEDLCRTHYQYKEYEFFRGTAQYIASEIRNQASSEQHTQQQIANKTKPNSHTYNTVMTKAYQMCRMHPEETHINVVNDGDDFERRKNSEGDSSCTIDSSCTVDSNIHTCLTPRQFEALTHWVKIGHSRRGLEKFSVPYLVEARPLSRKVAKNAVLVAQEVLNDFDNYIDKEKERMENEKSEFGNKRQRFMWGLLRSVSSFPGQKISKGKLENDYETEEGWRTALLDRLGLPKDFILPSLSKDQVLQIVSERYTRTAKLFAVVMGHADAAALQLHDNHSIST